MRSPLVVALLVATPAFAAPPENVVITSTRQSHGAMPAVAAGPPGWAVVWEEQPPKADRRTRRIGVAVVDAKGKLVAGPKLVMDGGGLPHDLAAVWNGKSWTVVVCNASWDDKGKMVWGELLPDGSFRQVGSKSFEGGEMSCAAPVAAAGVVSVAVVHTEESYDENDNPSGRTCAARRVTLEGATAKAGKATKLCTVLAADAAWSAGVDSQDRLVAVDAKGKARKLGDGQKLTATPTGFTALVWDKKGLAVARLAAPFTDKPAPQLLDKGPLGHAQVGHLFSLPGDGLALLGATPAGAQLALYDAAGKLRGEALLGAKGARYETCAVGEGALLCVWVDDDKTYQGEVRAARVPLP